MGCSQWSASSGRSPPAPVPETPNYGPTRRAGRSRDREAFEREVLVHLPAAYRLACVLTNRETDAEDLVQEACLRAFAGFSGYQQGTNARAWLLAIVRRIYLNDRRRDRRRPALLSFDEPSAGGGAPEPIDTRTPGPEEEVLRMAAVAQLRALLAGLPEPFRAAVVLIDVAGLRYAEAADVLGCPVGTVMSRLHRGRKLLAKQLNAQAAPASERELPQTMRRPSSLRGRVSTLRRVLR